MRIGFFGDCCIDQVRTIREVRVNPATGAPVYVHDGGVGETEGYPGMAANAAQALEHMPCDTLLVGPAKHLQPTKVSFVHEGKEALRMDLEPPDYGADSDRLDGIRRACVVSLLGERPDAIVVSDYDKGMVDGMALEAILSYARCKRIPVVINAKNFYEGVDYSGAIFQCNEAEFAILTGEDLGPEAMTELATERNLNLVVTRGRNLPWAYVVHLDANEIERQAAMPALQHPRLPRLTYQPSGAGDWFAAFLAYSSIHRQGCFVEHCHYAYRAAAAAGYFPPFRAPVLPREIEAIDKPERLKLLKSEDELLQWLKLRRQGRLVLTNGVFDLLHAGHVENLRLCRDMGEQLLVLVNGDRSAAAVKGRLPVMPVRDRMHLLTHLDCVSAVAAFHHDTPLELLSKCQREAGGVLDLYVKGDDTTLEEMARQVPVGYVENFALLTRTHHSTSSIRRHCQQSAG